ncbi:unnamed protein product [Protopolystoma xenopodis]|uniref:Uncharacterized protein n=1 Tax=Protopolystoma xenopodis TaxID=117903 RepID=A0A3S5A9E5_9PLAT|nr:unnamed protein product [Protopolystoma xenopodis]
MWEPVGQTIFFESSRLFADLLSAAVASTDAPSSFSIGPGYLSRLLSRLSELTTTRSIWLPNILFQLLASDVSLPNLCFSLHAFSLDSQSSSQPPSQAICNSPISTNSADVSLPNKYVYQVAAEDWMHVVVNLISLWSDHLVADYRATGFRNPFLFNSNCANKFVEPYRGKKEDETGRMDGQWMANPVIHFDDWLTTFRCLLGMRQTGSEIWLPNVADPDWRAKLLICSAFCMANVSKYESSSPNRRLG